MSQLCQYPECNKQVKGNAVDEQCLGPFVFFSVFVSLQVCPGFVVNLLLQDFVPWLPGCLQKKVRVELEHLVNNGHYSLMCKCTGLGGLLYCFGFGKGHIITHVGHGLIGHGQCLDALLLIFDHLLISYKEAFCLRHQELVGCEPKTSGSPF